MSGKGDRRLDVDFVPSEFLSLPGRLGLSAAPGWSYDPGTDTAGAAATDLLLLRHIHRTDLIVTLLQEAELASEGLGDLPGLARAAGLEQLVLPIPDLGVPASLDETRELVLHILGELGLGRTVVIHCLAGLGRSGTIGACVLVASGLSASSAVERVRWIRPGAIHNDRQEAFVSAFEHFVRGYRT